MTEPERPEAKEPEAPPPEPKENSAAAPELPHPEEPGEEDLLDRLSRESVLVDGVRRATQVVPVRVRRFLMSRVVLELLGIGTIVLVVLSLFARTERFGSWVRRTLAAELTLELRRPVSIGAVRASLLPPTLTLVDVEIANDPRDGRHPLLTAAEATVETGWMPIRWNGISLSSATLRGIDIRLRRFSDGSWNLPTPAGFGGGKDKRAGNFSIERLRLFDARVDAAGYQLPVGGEATLAAEWLEPASGEEARLLLRVAKAQVTARGEPVSASGTLVLGVRGRRFDLSDLSLVSDLGSLRSSGAIAQGARLRRGSIRISGLLHTDVLDRFLALGLRMAGDVAVEGNLEFDEKGPRFGGRARAADFRIRGARFEEPRLALSFASPEWKVELEQASLGGGRVEATVKGKGTTELEAEGKLAGVDASSILVPLAPGRPKVASRLDGSISAAGPPDNFEGWKGKVELHASPTSNGSLPVGGEVEASFEGRSAEITRAQLALPSARFTASGAVSLGERPSTLRFRAEVEDLASLQKLVAAWQLLPSHTEAAIPPLAGRLSGEGELVTGEARGVRIDARLSAEEATAAAFPLGSVTGRILGGEDRLEVVGVESRLPGGRKLDLTGRFTDWSRAGGPVVDLDVAAVRFSTTSVLGLIHLEKLDIGGEVTGRLKLDGPIHALDGGGRLELADARFWGQPADRVRGELRFESGALRLRDVEATLGTGTASGSGRIPADGLGYEFDATAVGLPLRAIAAIRPLLPEGTDLDIDARLRGDGTFDAPILSAEGTARNVTIAGRPFGPALFAIEASLAKGRVSLAASGKGGFRAEIEMPASAGGADGSWTISATSLSPFGELLGGTASSPVDGAIEASGTIRIPGPAWSAGGKVSKLEWRREESRLALAAPAKIELDRHGFRVASARLEGSRAALALSGEIAFEETTSLRGLLTGRLELSTLAPFLGPDVRLGGFLDVDLRAEGHLASPALFGSVIVSGGRALLPGLDGPIEAIEGRVDLRSDRLTTEGISARWSGGDFSVAGSARLDRFSLSDLHARLDAQHVPLRGWPGLELVGSGTVLASGDLARMALRGEVELEKAIYTEDFELRLDRLIERSPRPAGRKEVPAWMDRVDLELRLRAPGTLAVRNNVARISGTADLALLGTLGHPALLGQMTVAEGGELELQDVKYQVLSGNVFFTDPLALDPLFDLAAETELRGYRIRLDIAGTPSHFTPTFSSDPPLSETDILYLLLSGQTLDEAQFAETSQSLEAKLSAATQRTLTALTLEEVNRRGRQFFGLDRFSIDPVFGSDSQLDTARVTLGKKLSKRLTVTFSYNPQVGKEQILLVEYRLGENSFLQGTRDAEGVLAFDLKFRRRFH